jgi:hypothetical protein
MCTRRLLRTSTAALLGLSVALPSCASDLEPCLPVVPNDRVEITLGSEGTACVSLGLQEGTVLTATVRDFGPGPLNAECAVNCHDCLFVNVDVEPIAGFTWKWRDGLRGEVQGRLGGWYELRRDDGCSGTMEAALGTRGFSDIGTFSASFRPDPGIPIDCPGRCIMSIPASSRKF